jgi:hypothetical protein
MVDFGQSRRFTAIDIDFVRAPCATMAVIGSTDAVTWVDLKARTNDWVALRYLYLHFWNNATPATPPVLREIHWTADDK